MSRSNSQRLDQVEQELREEVGLKLGELPRIMEMLESLKVEQQNSQHSKEGETGGENHGDGGHMGSRRRTGGSDGGEQNERGNWRYKKLELPLWEGTNPDGWILRAERYFEFYRLNESEKVEAAIVALEGDALLWFQWENRRRRILTWDDFKLRLLKEFRSKTTGSLYEQWLALRQENTVSEYRKRFIELAAPLEGIIDEVMLGQFVNGLKEEMKREVRMLKPGSLEEAMEVSLRVEEKLGWEGGEKITKYQSPLNNKNPMAQNPKPKTH